MNKETTYLKHYQIWGVPSFCRSSHDLDSESTAGPEGLESLVELGHPQGQDVEKAGLFPTHARAFEPTLNDMFVRALHSTRTYGEPTMPGFLVSDPGPVPLHVAEQLGQRGADGLFPRSYPLERTQDRPDTVREECPHFLLHPSNSRL